ncbi:MAG TPA: TRAM domain-containing protein [Candidatus Nanoarchaeia archaeon]|nr:TRAM domain-containing protein [Candidatus Nanoarchaeia archaeon]
MTSFYIETYDTLYSADAEQMAGLLQQAKFEYKEKLEDADIVIMNTCAANSHAIDSFLTRLNTIKQEYPYKMMVVTGSLPRIVPERFKNFTIVGTRQFHHIVEAVEETLHNNIVKMLDTSEMPPLDAPKIRKNKFLEMIPISREGVKIQAKNKPETATLDSYPKADIVKVATKAVQEGVTEIWLTSPDCAGYGFDLGTNLPDLLKEFIQIPGNFKIRLDKCHPASLKKVETELFPLFTHEKMFKCIHIFFQSGSNKVLAQMQQAHTKEECIELVQQIRDIEPHITLVADMVVGYPTETDDDQWDTLNLLRAINADAVNISKFWEKPATGRAAPLAEEVVARRTAVIMDLVRNISTLRNERWKGWEGSIIISEKGTLPNQWIGRNEYYKPIMVEGEYKIGDTMNVRIAKAGTVELKGEKIE